MKFHSRVFTLHDICLTGVLGAAMLALSYAERLLTAALPLPPGVKPGIANVVVVFACSCLGFKSALCLTVIKSAFAALLSGLTAGFISLAGGLLSAAVTALLIKKARHKLSFIGISVLGALAHNLGQTAAACAVIGSPGYIYYLPVLVISAVITGTVTGSILQFVLPALGRIKHP